VVSFHYEEKVLLPKVPVHYYGSQSTFSGLDMKTRREYAGEREEKTL